MGLLDSINAKNLKSTLATASKVVQKAEDALKTVASATNEIVAEKQEASRQKKEAENAKKQREAEIASGYYMEGDQLMVTTTEGMKKWLQDLGKDTTPALMQVLQTQMQVIKYVESPSMTGMLFDNMILCLNKALKLTSDPVQLENIRESFALMMQNYFFMIETNLRCAEKKNSEETTTDNRFSIYKDIENLEVYKEEKGLSLGYVIAYTNNINYTEINTISKFNVGHDYILRPGEIKHHNKENSESVQLCAHYVFKWSKESESNNYFLLVQPLSHKKLRHES